MSTRLFRSILPPNDEESENEDTAEIGGVSEKIDKTNEESRPLRKTAPEADNGTE